MGRSRDREGSLASTDSGRTARSKKWDGAGGHRLHLSDLPMGVSKHEVERIFRSYGPLNEIWVATNPPCFAFINFTHRSDGERALKELDGTTLAGARIGLSWARPRHIGGRSRRRSPSPYRRSNRDSYSSSRRRRYSRSRSRSPRSRRSGGSSRRRSSRSASRSPARQGSPRDSMERSSRRKEHKRRRYSSSHSDRSPNRSPRRDNKKQSTRSPSHERQRSATPNGDRHLVETDDNHTAEIEIDGQD